jgi:hypothetical protein
VNNREPRTEEDWRVLLIKKTQDRGRLESSPHKESPGQRRTR